MTTLWAELASLFDTIRDDWEAHGCDWTQPGFRAMAVYRIGNCARASRRRFLRASLSLLYRPMFRYVRNHYGIELPASTSVGRRVVIRHQHGIVIHPHAVIGDECLIRQCVTIGAAATTRLMGAPKLGQRVHIGCGAAILGNVSIGDGAMIGPNAVVMTDIPAGARVFVESPRVIKLPQPHAAETRREKSELWPAGNTR